LGKKVGDDRWKGEVRNIPVLLVDAPYPNLVSGLTRSGCNPSSASAAVVFKIGYSNEKYLEKGNICR
jgi:hypothetical protein